MEPNGCHGTILVAEDEPQVLDLVVNLLSLSGYTVLAASDAEEALRIAQGHQGSLDLLLTDIVMPGMHGNELAQHLCASLPSLRVTYMSGYFGKTIDSVHLLKPGDSFLAKPFTAKELLATVREALDAPVFSP